MSVLSETEPKPNTSDHFESGKVQNLNLRNASELFAKNKTDEGDGSDLAWKKKTKTHNTATAPAVKCETKISISEQIERQNNQKHLLQIPTGRLEVGFQLYSSVHNVQ